jgi:hypothetical protein
MVITSFYRKRAFLQIARTKEEVPAGKFLSDALKV